jgi:hypothetical protein
MSKPRASLASVQLERLEPGVEISRKRAGAPVLVVEYEHADAARLAIADRRRRGRLPDGAGCFSQRFRDALDVCARAGAEEGERDVQIGAPHDPSAAGELALLPVDDAIQHLLRKGESAEEPKPLTAFHASSGGHTGLSRF